MGYHLNQQLLCLVAAGPKMQLACLPCGVSLPEAEQACTPGFPTGYLTWFEGPKWGSRMTRVPLRFCSCLLSPISGVIVSRDDPSRW